MARRGTAIIETKKGILVVKELTDNRYALVGGQAQKNETRKSTAVRETKEETSLEAIAAKELFELTTQSKSGRTTYHKIILIKAEGTLYMTGKFNARTNCPTEISTIGFFNLGYLHQPNTNKYQGHVYAVLKHYISNYRKDNISKFVSDEIKFKKLP